MLSKLEMACMVHWGEFAHTDDCVLAEREDTPEAQVIFSDLMEKLSDDSKLMISTIVNLPDEMFYKRGGIIIEELKSWMFRRYDWPSRKVDRCRQEITKQFGRPIV